MARKSQWAQFAENFKNTYEIANKVQQGYQTRKIMDDEEFTAEGNAGAGLSGNALEKARYKALGDIATKYGDAAGGLANRTALADLEAKDRDNTINQGIMKELAYLRGQGAVRNLDANSYASEGAGINSRSSAADRTATIAARLKRMEADTSGVFSQIEKRNAEIEALKLQNASTQAQQSTADAAAISSFELLKAQNDGDLANIDLRNQASQETYRAAIYDARAAGEASQLAELETIGFLDYSKRFNAGEFKTGQEATEAYVNVVAAFDPDKATDLMQKYTEKEISQIANQGLEFQATVAGLVQKNDFEGIRAFFDEQNGDATGVTLDINSETGAIKMFQTGPEGEIIPIMDAANATEARSQIESVATYGNAASYAESLFARRKDEAGLAQTQAQTAFTLENTEGLAGNRAYTKAQLDLANVRARQIRAEIRQKYSAAGKAELLTQANQKALDKFLTTNLPLIAFDDNLDVDALVQKFLTSRKQTAITFDPAD